MMKISLSPSPESRLIRFRSLPQNLLVLVADTVGSFGGRFSFFWGGGWTVGGLYDTTDTLFLFFRIFRIFEFSNTSLVSRTFFAETTVRQQQLECLCNAKKRKPSLLRRDNDEVHLPLASNIMTRECCPSIARSTNWQPSHHTSSGPPTTPVHPPIPRHSQCHSDSPSSSPGS